VIAYLGAERSLWQGGSGPYRIRRPSASQGGVPASQERFGVNDDGFVCSLIGPDE
jgi:hypothetical protein